MTQKIPESLKKLCRKHEVNLTTKSGRKRSKEILTKMCNNKIKDQEAGGLLSTGRKSDNNMKVCQENFKLMQKALSYVETYLFDKHGSTIDWDAFEKQHGELPLSANQKRS